MEKELEMDQRVSVEPFRIKEAFYHKYKAIRPDVEELDFYILMNAIFSLHEKACGLVQRGWCISEKLDG